jgi:hypothetical protein
MPVTTQFSLELKKLGTWGTNRLWYKTQKEHWLGWLEGYGGPGYYGRKDWNRDGEFVYNHIVCPPMVLWLGEACGISATLVRKAKKSALGARPNLSAQAAAIRRVIPWELIEDRLSKPSEKLALEQPAKRRVSKPASLDKSDAKAAHSVIDSVFQGFSADAKESYLQFLATSIERLSPEHSDRWGTTLFEWGIRLNVGWVECLVLHPDGLNVLLCKESAPACVKLNGFRYRWAPGCDMATVPLSELTKTLPLLRGSHDEAVSIAARRPTNPTVRKGHSEGVAKLLSKRLNHKVTTDESETDANQSRYARPFNKWIREFSAAAAADNYAELLRPIEHLELKCSPKNAIAATIALVNAIVAFCKLDGRDCETFLKQQHYRFDPDGACEYCLLFDLSDSTNTYFGRILTDLNFTSIDLEDLFDYPWPMSRTAGFTDVYITRLDGERIGKREWKSLQKIVTSDMYYGHSEEELSVDVLLSDFEDTVVIYAGENEVFE